MPAAACGKETVGAALGSFEALGAAIQSAARPAPHTGIRRRVPFGRGIAAPLASRRPQVGNEDHVVTELAGEPFDSPFFPVFNLLPPSLTNGITGSYDVGRHLMGCQWRIP